MVFNTITQPWEDANRPYRADKTPQDFMLDGWTYEAVCPCRRCREALAKYESWRLSPTKPSDALASLTYPQAVEILRNVITSLGEPSMRGFSYGGEWRDRDWLLSVLEVALKGPQERKPDLADEFLRGRLAGGAELLRQVR